LKNETFAMVMNGICHKLRKGYWKNGRASLDNSWREKDRRDRYLSERGARAAFILQVFIANFLLCA
jgi:hypothetical protein